MRTSLLFALLFVAGLAGCRKNDFDAAKQAAIDDEQIRTYLATNAITAQHDDNGLYYVISAPGTGSHKYTSASAITANYTCRLLTTGKTVDSGSAAKFTLGRVIAGWRLGIPLIQKGGKIRLFVPSGLAYGNQSPDKSIPENSILDFDIELLDAQN